VTEAAHGKSGGNDFSSSGEGFFGPIVVTEEEKEEFTVTLP